MKTAFGQYSTEVFSSEAERIIAEHDVSKVCYSEAERIIAEHDISKVCYSETDRQNHSPA